MDYVHRNRFQPRVQYINLTQDKSKQQLQQQQQQNQQQQHRRQNTTSGSSSSSVGTFQGHFKASQQNNFFNGRESKRLSHDSRKTSQTTSPRAQDQSVAASFAEKAVTATAVLNLPAKIVTSAAQKLNKMGDINTPITYEELQNQSVFVQFPEFEGVAESGQVMVSVQLGFNAQAEQAISGEESAEEFEECLNALRQGLARAFPFIDLFVHRIADEGPDQQIQNEILQKSVWGLFEVQLCARADGTEVRKRVLYSKQLQRTLPTVEKVLENIKKSLTTVDLVLQLECAMNGAYVFGEGRQQYALEGLAVTLKQQAPPRDRRGAGSIIPSQTFFTNAHTSPNDSLSSSFVGGTASAQNVTNTQNCTGSLKAFVDKSVYFSSNKKAQSGARAVSSTQSVRLYLSPTKSYVDTFHSSFMKTNQSGYSHQRSQSRESQQGCETTATKKSAYSGSGSGVQLFVVHALTERGGRVVLKDVIREIGVYDLTIQGNTEVLPYKQRIDLKDLRDKLSATATGSATATLFQKCTLEAQDQNLTRVQLEIVDRTKSLTDAAVTIGDYEFYGDSTPTTSTISVQDNRIHLSSKHSVAENSLQISQKSTQKGGRKGTMETLTHLQFSDFYVRPGSYFFEIARERYNTEYRFQHFKRGCTKIRLEMQPLAQPKISIAVKNLFTHQPVGHCQISLTNRAGDSILLGCGGGIQAASGGAALPNAQASTRSDGLFKQNMLWHAHINAVLEHQDYLPLRFSFQLDNSHCAKDFAFEAYLIPRHLHQNLTTFLKLFKARYMHPDESLQLFNKINRGKVFDELFLSDGENLISYGIKQQLPVTRKGTINSTVSDKHTNQKNPTIVGAVNNKTPLSVATQQSTPTKQQQLLLRFSSTFAAGEQQQNNLTEGAEIAANEHPEDEISFSWTHKLRPEFLRAYTHGNTQNQQNIAFTKQQHNQNCLFYVNEKIELKEPEACSKLIVLQKDGKIIDLVTVPHTTFLQLRAQDGGLYGVRPLLQPQDILLSTASLPSANKGSATGKLKNKENNVSHSHIPTEGHDSSSPKKLTFSNKKQPVGSPHKRNISLFAQ